MNKNWELKKLGEICEVIAGQSPEGKYYNKTGNGLPFYQGKKEFTDKYIGEPTTWTTSTTKEAQQGDILMSVRAPVGPVNFSTEKICIGRGLAAIRPSKLIDKEYLFNFLLKHENEIVGNAGAVFDSINQTQIKNISIPLPSLTEQQRIVSILDETFAAIDKAKENAKKNLQNARELFESYLQGVFTNTRDGWERKKLGRISVVNMGQSPKGSSYNTTGDGVPLINGPVEFGGDDPFSKTLKTKFTTKPTKMCKQGDLILCVRGSTTGRMNIAGFDSCIGRGVASISSEEYQDWINQYINFNRDTIYKLGTGATFPNVSSSTLSNLLIPIPPKEQQYSIIAKLDALSSETKRLEEIYQQKLAALDELKKSVLQKAFNGELAGA